MRRIKKEIFNKIIQHAKRDVPIEACGYLACRGDIITKHYELTNIDQSQEHFAFDPQEQFEVVRDARNNDLEICAVYHSHPETPARPSDEDIKLAYDKNLSYVIISLAEGKEDVKSFRIIDSNVQNESLEAISDDQL